MTDEWEMSQAAFKRMKETYKSKDKVIPTLERHVMRRFQEENDVGRANHVIHPSDMAKKYWCPRKDWYRICAQPPSHKVKNPGFSMSNVLTNGHEIHAKYQGWFDELGVLWGDWRCVMCTHRWTALSPESCPECGAVKRFVEYREVPLSRPPYAIEGSADGAIHDLDGYTGLIEVKSVGIGTLRFEAPRLHQRFIDGEETLDSLVWKINRPFPSHMRQGQVYLWLSWPRYERIAFIYEYKWNQRVKEFVVEYNPRIIAPLVEMAKVLGDHLEAGTPPDRPDWTSSKQDAECATCEYRGTCWSTDETQDEATPVSLPVIKADARTRRSALSQT